MPDDSEPQDREVCLSYRREERFPEHDIVLRSEGDERGEEKLWRRAGETPVQTAQRHDGRPTWPQNKVGGSGRGQTHQSHVKALHCYPENGVKTFISTELIHSDQHFEKISLAMWEQTKASEKMQDACSIRPGKKRVFWIRRVEAELGRRRWTKKKCEEVKPSGTYWWARWGGRAADTNQNDTETSAVGIRMEAGPCWDRHRWKRVRMEGF